MNNNDEVLEYLVAAIRLMIDERKAHKQQREYLAQEVPSLKNQLRDATARETELQSELQHRIDLAAGVYRWSTAHFDEKGKVFKVEGGVKTAQSGCCKENTQECEHDWRRALGAHFLNCVKCSKCGLEK